MNTHGILIVVSGFSGSGKGTIMKELLKRYDNYALSISATTRAPRKGETDGREYFFKTREEFEKMFEKDFTLQCEETTLVPVNLKSWMELTDTPEDVQKEITELMKTELSGGSKTGFSPYKKESQIMFDHRWLLLIGIKN